MPASRTTWRPPRSRTWRTRATSQPARATSARPGSIARRVGRRSAGMPSSSAGSSRAKRSGVGDGSPTRADREAATEVERVERLDRSAPERGERQRLANAVPPGVDGAELRPDVQVDAARPERRRWAGPAAGLDGLADLRLGHAELGAARPDRESGQRLGRDVRVEPVQDVERRRARPARGPGEGRGLLGRFEGHPAQRAPSAAARTAARRSAGVLPIPSSVIRSFGTPARRASAHSPRETTFAPNPRAGDRRDDRRDVVRLDRVLADHGSGNAPRRPPRMPRRAPRGR